MADAIEDAHMHTWMEAEVTLNFLYFLIRDYFLLCLQPEKNRWSGIFVTHPHTHKHMHIEESWHTLPGRGC